jgi:hypothetical protein
MVWLSLVVVSLLAGRIVLLGAPPVQADGISPRDIATTDDEAGKQAARAVDKDGGDDRSAWVELRWERQPDSPDYTTGPATVDNTIWVAKDLSSARAIYQEQAAKTPDFPEAFYAHKGPYPLPISASADDISGLSACLDCNAKDEVFLHHRVVFRRGSVVGVLYLYGTDKTAPQDLASWYVSQVVKRVPDAAIAAPEHAGQEQAATDSPPPSSDDQAQQDQPAASGSGATSAPAPAPAAAVIQANPKDLAVKLGEAGKNAKVKADKNGSDQRGTWYEVRYERDGTGSRFYQGPVTIYNLVIVAADVDSAKKTYQDQVALNDKLPEATEKVGQKFELKGAGEIGDEAAGVSACEKSCNAGGDIYVHKRLVSRVANVVSVTYLWGLSDDQGTNDASARFFGGLVVDRAHGAQG